MNKTDLRQTAAQLHAAWHSTVIGRAGGAQLKVLRMDGQPYAAECHPFDEALLVLEGELRLDMGDEVLPVRAGEVVVVPAGQPHAVARGSWGTLVIVDGVE